MGPKFAPGDIVEFPNTQDVEGNVVGEVLADSGESVLVVTESGEHTWVYTFEAEAIKAE